MLNKFVLYTERFVYSLILLTMHEYLSIFVGPSEQVLSGPLQCMPFHHGKHGRSRIHSPLEKRPVDVTWLIRLHCTGIDTNSVVPTYLGSNLGERLRLNCFSSRRP